MKIFDTYLNRCQVTGQHVGLCADSQTVTPTFPVFSSGSKPFRQLAANRCLRGFISVSGIATIPERVRALRTQTTWMTAQSLISTDPDFTDQVDVASKSDSHRHTFCRTSAPSLTPSPKLFYLYYYFVFYTMNLNQRRLFKPYL